MNDSIITIMKNKDPFDCGNSTIEFEAKGRRCQNVDDEYYAPTYKRIIEKTGYDVGKEIYLVDWRVGCSGCYEMGWMVVFDVEDLFDKVFKNKRESIIEAVENTKGKSVIAQFEGILDENGIRYGDDCTRID